MIAATSCGLLRKQIGHRHVCCYRMSIRVEYLIEVVREVRLSTRCCPWRKSAIRQVIQWDKFTLSTHYSNSVRNRTVANGSSLIKPPYHSPTTEQLCISLLRSACSSPYSKIS